VNRPLVITAIGVVVIVVAIAANFLVWQQEVAEEPITGQAAAPQAAADAAAHAAELAAEKARSAAKMAEHAKMAAQVAAEKAKAPEAGSEAKEAAEQAESEAAEATKMAEQAAAEAEAAQAVAEAAAQAAKVIESAPEAAPQPQVASTTPAKPAPSSESSPAAQTAASSSPSFDVVRINPKGDTVMAGRAEPGSNTKILDRGKVIGDVTADKRGEWVFIPEKPLPPGTSELTLESSTSDGRTITSDSSVMLVVPEKGKDIAGRPTDEPSQPLALMVPTEKPEMVTVPDKPIPSVLLQKPTSGEAQLPLTIDLVDYDDEGRLSIGGRAESGSQVQLYLDNEFIGRATSDGDGKWRVIPEIQVDPGLYTLRADQVDASGKVLARIVIPFARAEPLSPGPGRYVVVQPGNSLWRIARRTYGTGFDYSVIYEANTEQIADPDMIFPGQIFALPKGKG
jgi:nucleoid-associated protein YgaU